MKVYGHCENKCKKEVYSKDESYSKEEVYTKAETNSYVSNNYMANSDFAVVTGQVTAIKSDNPGNTHKQTTTQVNFPEGFNAENCVVVSMSSVNNDYATAQHVTRVYTFDENVANSSATYIRGNLPSSIVFQGPAEYMTLYFYNIGSSDKEITYKIVLMKTKSNTN